jgi:hypothetical protein
LCRRTIEILHERDVNTPIELSPNQATELLTAAQDESREELAELWARLLANAIDPNMNNIRHSFIDVVKNMDPVDAIVLRLIYGSNIAAIRAGRTSDFVNRTTGIENIAMEMRRRDDEVEVSLRHLKSLLLLDDMIGNPGSYVVNATTREFLRACYPEVTPK